MEKQKWYMRLYLSGWPTLSVALVYMVAGLFEGLRGDYEHLAGSALNVGLYVGLTWWIRASADYDKHMGEVFEMLDKSIKSASMSNQVAMHATGELERIIRIAVEHGVPPLKLKVRHLGETEIKH